MNRYQIFNILYLSNLYNKKEIVKDIKIMLYGMICKYNENFWDIVKFVLMWEIGLNMCLGRYIIKGNIIK